jgi:hypothetical protein
MKLAISVLVALIVVAVGAVGIANAVTIRHSTTITHDSSVHVNGEFVDSGRVHSHGISCEANREVLLTARDDEGHLVLLDADRTSIGGAWATQANYDGGFVRVKARVKPRTYRTDRGFRHVCKAASIVWAAP